MEAIDTAVRQAKQASRIQPIDDKYYTLTISSRMRAQIVGVHARMQWKERYRRERMLRRSGESAE